MTSIKKYRKQKIFQLIIGVIWLVGIYFFVDSSIIQVGMFAFILFIGIAYSPKLLTNIKINDEFFIFETYSIITQKEDIKISESEITDVVYTANSLFNSHNLILKYNGKNGIISKKLYLNAEPWSKLTSDLKQIKSFVNNID